MPSMEHSQSSTLLQTKFHRPPLVAGLMPRPPLLALLDQGETCTLTLVVAPAGAGKTSLVCQWLEERAAPAAWLQLDANDGEPALLFTYIVHALRRSVLRALLLARAAEHQAAIELLTGGLRLTAAAGFVRTYVELGPGLADLLRAIDEPELDGCVASILAAFPNNQPPPRAPSLLLDSPAATLTVRELEVLALLASPMTPEEIAQALAISYSTVRHHTSRIYEKLGVNKRRHAVLAATELGLLK